ncbi:MAG: hypothetical protein Q4A65_06605 [Bacillota bacterium]|nr:hypothetical protein [Bacillota bacterium]
MDQNDYLIETRLHQLNPKLHRRFSESLFVLPGLLSRYTILFPEFTDHSETHSMAIVDYCNQIMGKDIISRLNADELYVLLMGCYLHDIGMGISQKEYEEFCPQIDFGDYYEGKKNSSMQGVVRAFHSEFSGCFIRKYAALFDLPSEEHLQAIVQVTRGHRVVDLFDEQEYPEKLKLKNGNTISMPFLAAVLRLADDLNVAKDRNSRLFFDPDNHSTERQRLENLKHEAIRKMEIYPDRIEMEAVTDDPQIRSEIIKLAGKLQKSLDYCADVVSRRSDFRLTQKKIELKINHEEIV